MMMPLSWFPSSSSLCSRFWVVLFCLTVTTRMMTTTTAVHRTDQSLYFLFIEPEQPPTKDHPVDDELTQSLQAAMAMAVKGTSGYANPHCHGKFTTGGGSYRGFHFCTPHGSGMTSDVYDYQLPNGYITNSCAVHYVRHHRHEIPATEMQKLHAVHQFMMQTQQHSDQRESSSHRPLENNQKSPPSTTTPDL